MTEPVLITRRGLPVCPDCLAEIECTVCRPPGVELTDKSREAIAEIVVAAHRKLGHCEAAPSGEPSKVGDRPIGPETDT